MGEKLRLSEAAGGGSPLPWVIAAAIVALAWWVSVRQSLLFGVGVGMGVALAGARFGFATGWRRLLLERDPRAVLAQLLLLAVAAVLSIPLLGLFPELTAALGPPSVSLLIGAFFFGLTMQIADGCGSGTLYKAGLGVPLNLAILPLFAFGSFTGAAHLDSWLSLGHMRPIGLVDSVGVPLALWFTVAALAAIALLVLRFAAPQSRRCDRRSIAGALILAVLAAANLLIAGQPWGVVYGFGLWGAKAATAFGFDAAANAYWGQAVQLEHLSASVLTDVTSITNIGILAGALALSGKSGAPNDGQLTARQWIIGMVAGFVMGYSSRLAFGCNVGAMVGGISTGSLHGWIWLPFAFAGTVFGVGMRRRLGFSR